MGPDFQNVVIVGLALVNVGLLIAAHARLSTLSKDVGSASSEIRLLWQRQRTRDYAEELQKADLELRRRFLWEHSHGR